MPIRKSNDTLFYLFGTIPVIWLALLLAQSLGGGLPELLRNLTVALEQPTNIICAGVPSPLLQRRSNSSRPAAAPRSLCAGRVCRHAAAGIHARACDDALTVYLSQCHHSEHGTDQRIV